MFSQSTVGCLEAFDVSCIVGFERLATNDAFEFLASLLDLTFDLVQLVVKLGNWQKIAKLTTRKITVFLCHDFTFDRQSVILVLGVNAIPL